MCCRHLIGLVTRPLQEGRWQRTLRGGVFAVGMSARAVVVVVGLKCYGSHVVTDCLLATKFEMKEWIFSQVSRRARERPNMALGSLYDLLLPGLLLSALYFFLTWTLN